MVYRSTSLRGEMQPSTSRYGARTGSKTGSANAGAAHSQLRPWSGLTAKGCGVQDVKRGCWGDRGEGEGTGSPPAVTERMPSVYCSPQPLVLSWMGPAKARLELRKAASHPGRGVNVDSRSTSCAGDVRVKTDEAHSRCRNTNRAGGGVAVGDDGKVEMERAPGHEERAASGGRRVDDGGGVSVVVTDYRYAASIHE
eukprot:3173343-Prymnesium_polylepis.1